MRSIEIRDNGECRRRRFSRFFVSLGLLSVCSVFQALAQSRELSSNAADWAAKSKILSQKLESGNSEEKRDALFEIRNLKSEQASRLAVAALRDANEIIRATAAGSVIFLPDDEAPAALIPLLSDKAEFVRREAAYALGEVGSASATAPLVKALKSDKVLEVRTAAAVALGKVGDPLAVAELVSLLKTKPSEEGEFLRRSAARSIGQIAQIIKTGRRQVLTPQNFLPERYKEMPPSQTSDLTRQFRQLAPAVPILINVLKNRGESDDTRREAAFALGAIGDESAIAALIAETNAADPYLAEIAKEAISQNHLR